MVNVDEDETYESVLARVSSTYKFILLFIIVSFQIAEYFKIKEGLVKRVRLVKCEAVGTYS